MPGMEPNAIDTLKDWAAKAQSVADAGRANGYKKLKIADKLKMADLEQEYVSYGFLCGFTHNQLTGIIARHGKHQLKYLHEPPYATTAGVLGLGLSIAGKAIQKLPAFSDLTDSEVNASVDEIEASWERART